MKHISLLIILIFTASCESEKQFFDFDEAYHYQISAKESEYYILNSATTREKNEFEKIAFGFKDFPTDLNDKWFFEKLELFYLKKQKLSDDKLKELSAIFTERREEKTEFTLCEPTFRNIFIFKKKGKVVGISKICFGCKMEYTIGNNGSTENFGSEKEYERLKNLVK